MPEFFPEELAHSPDSTRELCSCEKTTGIYRLCLDLMCIYSPSHCLCEQRRMEEKPGNAED